MRRCRRVAPIARLCGMFGLLTAGCMPLGYAYPTVSYVPPTRVGPARDEVRAFRVDVADDRNCLDVNENDRYVLKPLPLHRDGSTDPQVKVAVDYGWLLASMVLTYDGATHHTVLVRLYRPGFHTLEVESWQKSAPLHWTEAPTPLEQEVAIDDLVSTWKTAPERLQNRYAYEGFVPPREAVVFQYLAPGSTSEAHRQALHFAAGEYERLLKDAADPDLRKRLEEKSKALRQLAAR